MQLEKTKNLPNSNTMIVISIGLIILAIVSSAFVYAETSSVNVDGVSHNVDYTGDGVLINSIDADLDFISLLISVDVTGSPGTLDITFDRNFFDSTFNGSDEDFIVLIDADEATFSETNTTTQSRTLSITIPEGTEEIEIIGSMFGTDQPVEEPKTTTEPEPEPEVMEKEIPASFIDSSKDPKYYVQRYLNEPSYKTWFEENYPDYTFYEALDISKSRYDNIVKELTSKPSETPVEEKPKPETKPKTECGSGTILKDGECVIDQRCGTGTIMKDGECVVTSHEETTLTTKEAGKELIIGLIASFIVAGTIGIILALMSKASKSKN